MPHVATILCKPRDRADQKRPQPSHLDWSPLLLVGGQACLSTWPHFRNDCARSTKLRKRKKQHELFLVRPMLFSQAPDAHATYAGRVVAQMRRTNEFRHHLQHRSTCHELRKSVDVEPEARVNIYYGPHQSFHHPSHSWKQDFVKTKLHDKQTS